MKQSVTDGVRERLSREQAADYLGVAVQTLASWASTGKYQIPFLRVGSKVQYRKADLDRWLDSRVVGGVNETQLVGV